LTIKIINKKATVLKMIFGKEVENSVNMLA